MEVAGRVPRREAARLHAIVFLETGEAHAQMAVLAVFFNPWSSVAEPW